MRDAKFSHGASQIPVFFLLDGDFGHCLPPLGVGFTRHGLAVRDGANRIISFNNLYVMGLAMHGYADANGTFPPAANCDAQGIPLLSWRVAILPYVGAGSLYSKFKLDEPWDGPNNIKLLPLIPMVRAFPISRTVGALPS